MSDNEDDIPQLSAESLTALQEFYEEQAQKEEKLRSILDGGENSVQNINIDEDWVTFNYSVS